MTVFALVVLGLGLLLVQRRKARQRRAAAPLPPRPHAVLDEAAWRRGAPSWFAGRRGLM